MADKEFADDIFEEDEYYDDTEYAEEVYGEDEYEEDGSEFSGVTGLNSEQVRRRIENGEVNVQSGGLTQSVGKIVLKNIFTLFNIISVFLAVLLILVKEYRNILFVGVVLSNLILGIFQELKSKRSLDKLSVLVKAKVTVLRDGKLKEIPQNELVMDDTFMLAAGNQVCADGEIILSERLEMDESLLTGEADRIQKREGDTVLSGSYVTSGRAFARVIAVGDDSYAHSLTSEAKKSKKKTPKLLRTLNRIILILTFVIFPLGGALFYSKRVVSGHTLNESVLGMTTSVLGMIPSGLVLLTGITMMLGAMKLARKKALVQSLPSIETLARTDVLCLDKTGTITDGTLAFERMKIYEDISEDSIKTAVSELMGGLNDANSTAKAMINKFGKTRYWKPEITVPFSSDRKWSGVTFKNEGTYILGAPNIIFSDTDAGFMRYANQEASEGLRVLCLAFSPKKIVNDRLPNDLRCLALLVFSDNIRKNAAETFSYFAKEEVILKVISGDNPRTVSAVAKKAGLANADMICDMNLCDEQTDYAQIAEEYTIFGHVTPQQKRELIRGMKQNGHTVCMTGDGVNDILAMRESDCSVAMVGGSDAARSACDFVLMSEDFGSMVDVLKEGRRVINNIEKVASIFLMKTVYSVILTLLYIFIPRNFPILPAQMTPINEMTVAVPAFFLTLQTNYFRPAGKLLKNFLHHTLPASITVIFNTLYIQYVAELFDVPFNQLSTFVAFLIGVVGFYLLLQVAKPFTPRLKMMMVLLVAGFILFFTLPPIRDFIQLSTIFTRNCFLFLPLIYFSYHIHFFLGNLFHKIVEGYKILRDNHWLNKEEEETA